MTALSHVTGSDTPPLLDETIGQVFDRTVREHGERDALVVCHQDIRFTWAGLSRRVDDAALWLLELGLAPGDRLGLWAPNCAEWLIVQFAAAKTGLILVNLNPAYRIGELEYALARSGCSALISAPAFKSSDYVAMLNELLPELAAARPGALDASALPELRAVVLLDETEAPGCLCFPSLRSAGERPGREHLEALAAGLDPRDAINIQFTSGTTGSPKGATLSHYGVVNNALMIGEPMRFGADDRLLIQVPLYHAFGMIMATLTCAVRGACMVLPSASFDPVASLRAIEAERCTALHGVPTMFIEMLDHPDFRRFDVGSLRTGIMAGSPCPVELMKRVISELHMDEVTIGYGMTETSALGFQTRPDDSLERRVGTVGRVHPHVEAKIVDEKGQTVPRGEPGEILTRGYGVMLGYWEDAARSAEAIDADGWMHSGDLGTLDEDGYCNIVGRIKDMVIRGGENIFPREVEEFLHQHERVQDVQVFGVPDPKYGEELCAWIRLLPGTPLDEDDVRAFCRGRIAHFKIPRYIRFVEDFPMTVTGKIQKYQMRQEMARQLGVADETTA